MKPLKVTRRATKRGQRVRFSCPACGAFGDASGDVEWTEAILTHFTSQHPERCQDGKDGAA